MRAVLIVLVATSTAAHADTTQRDPSLCTAIHSLSADLDLLARMSVDSTVSQARQVTERLMRDVRQVQLETMATKTPATRVFLASSERLIVQANLVPDELPLAQLDERIAGDVHNVRQSMQTIGQEAACPAR